MGEITSITIIKEVRVNTGDFEGTVHRVEMTSTVDEFDDPMEVHKSLHGTVVGALVGQLVRAYRVRGKKGMTPERISQHHGL